MGCKSQRIVRKLLSDNPGLEIRDNGRHRKLFLNGKLIGILPWVLRQEGLSPNLISQFRRAGLKVNA